MLRTGWGFSGPSGMHEWVDLKQGWTVVRKVDAAVETVSDRECTLGLVWAWACELGKAERKGQQMGQMTFRTWTWTGEGT